MFISELANANLHFTAFINWGILTVSCLNKAKAIPNPCFVTRFCFHNLFYDFFLLLLINKCTLYSCTVAITHRKFLALFQFKQN